MSTATRHIYRAHTSRKSDLSTESPSYTKQQRVLYYISSIIKSTASSEKTTTQQQQKPTTEFYEFFLQLKEIIF